MLSSWSQEATLMSMKRNSKGWKTGEWFGKVFDSWKSNTEKVYIGLQAIETNLSRNMAGTRLPMNKLGTMIKVPIPKDILPLEPFTWNISQNPRPGG